MELLREIYDCWGQGDYSRVDFFQPDFELVYGPDFLDEGVFKGLAEAGRGWQQWVGEWASWQAKPTRFVELDGGVLVLATVEGVAKASGMKLSAEAGNLWEFRDGLVSRLVIYAHAANALRDAGIQ
jgi:ketosteroid isomerase-like protein